MRTLGDLDQVADLPAAELRPHRLERFILRREVREDDTAVPPADMDLHLEELHGGNSTAAFLTADCAAARTAVGILRRRLPASTLGRGCRRVIERLEVGD